MYQALAAFGGTHPHSCCSSVYVSVHAADLSPSVAHDDTRRKYEDSLLFWSHQTVSHRQPQWHEYSRHTFPLVICLPKIKSSSPVKGGKSVQTDTCWNCLYGSIVTAKCNNNLFMSTKRHFSNCYCVWRLET